MSRRDVIIVGAGSAGCVLAARLTEDEGRTVLLLEGGGSDRTAFCTVPGMVSVIHTVPQVKKRFDWGYKSEPNPLTLDREVPTVRGKVLGGSSAINGMVFVRGNRANFDGWAADGAPGWSYDEVLPYFRKLEDYDGGADAWRGAGGPIKVSRPTGISPVSEAFLPACAGTCGVEVIADYNGERQEGAALFQLSSRDGLRSSTSEAYLHPNLGRPGLEVVSGATVDRVHFQGDRATGLTYRVGREVRRVEADEIILAAGSVGTPLVLLRSGVGPAAHLREHGIPVVADLPVGRNLHDHLFFPLTFLTPRGGHRGTPLHFLSGMVMERIFGGTWFGRSVFETVAFVRTPLARGLPDLQIHTIPWAYPSPNQDDVEVRPKVDLRPAFTLHPTLIYPESRGEIRLTSPDPEARPRIDPHYLEADADREVLLHGIEICREIMAHPAMAGEVTGELHPGPTFTGAALRDELPRRVATVYHPVGTCRMGTDERAVVDPDQLRVHGVRGLRVVDASVFPSITGGNTNAPTIMIAERAADRIRGRVSARQGPSPEL